MEEMLSNPILRSAIAMTVQRTPAPSYYPIETIERPPPTAMPLAHRFIDYRAAVLIVIANMIGTGVFATLGLQAQGVRDGAALLLLWLLGGLVAPVRCPVL